VTIRGVVVALLLLGAPSVASAREHHRRPRLSPDLALAVGAHEELAQRARASPYSLCALVADSYELLARLEREVSYDDQDSLKVTGIFFVMGPEFTRTGVDYTALRKLAGPEDARLLRSMAVLDGTWQGISCVAAWSIAETDFTGCHSPAQATAPLTELVKAWRAASPCLRDALARSLDELLGQMAGDANFCKEDRALRLSAVRANAALMRKLAGTNGAERAAELQHTADESIAGPPRVLR
jgi:hypothetical protein